MVRTFPVQGTGVFKPSGKPSLDISATPGDAIFAVDDGQVHFSDDATHGVSATVIAHDGSEYFYLRMGKTEGADERQVKAGEVIGRIGDGPITFQVRPQGGPAVDPVPLFNRISETPPIDVAPVPTIGPVVPSTSPDAHALPVAKGETPAKTRAAVKSSASSKASPLWLLFLAFVLLSKKGGGPWL